MKRSHQNIPDPSASSNEGRSKKPKALQACLNCRRSKVRCQTLDSEGSISWPSKIACRRCTSLNISCSFAETNNPPLDSYIPTDDTLHSEPGSSTSIHHVPMTLAENIESIRNQDIPWDELDKGVFDYTTSPVVALEIAIRRKYSPGSTSIGIGDDSGSNRLDDILSDAQKYELLNLQVPMSNDLVKFFLLIGGLYRFQKNYFPWLNLPDDDALNEDPTWILAQCAVASRHFDDTIQPDVEYHLRKAAEYATFSQVFSPCPSLAAIQSLLVLSVWPLSRKAHPEQIRDHRMQLTSAITMAKNRKFHGQGEGLDNRLVGEPICCCFFLLTNWYLVVDIASELGLCVSTLLHFY